MSTWPTVFSSSEITSTLSPTKVGRENDETKYKNARVHVPYNEENLISINNSFKPLFIYITYHTGYIVYPSSRFTKSRRKIVSSTSNLLT